ncbi:hypothetical protein G7077_02735 [Sphingomonas piscis]|uniref:Uncharacterized protein n=1 Tax=Sphingomonas piscis TaxID=2714943 RepID=A0A6G7YMP1_9SPHN|nr:hypothetical protein [Sphingomonas piscis]QIK77986.1 hypothetical protein G7077_02735 [Sphingomonas piscis]
MNAAIEQAICNYVWQREPSNPATYQDLVGVALKSMPMIGDNDLTALLGRLIRAGKIEQFEDDERGTVYTRDC